jgi:hypothetical protein
MLALHGKRRLSGGDQRRRPLKRSCVRVEYAGVQTLVELTTLIAVIAIPIALIHSWIRRRRGELIQTVNTPLAGAGIAVLSLAWFGLAAKQPQVSWFVLPLLGAGIASTWLSLAIIRAGVAWAANDLLEIHGPLHTTRLSPSCVACFAFEPQEIWVGRLKVSAALTPMALACLADGSRVPIVGVGATSYSVRGGERAVARLNDRLRRVRGDASL